MHHGRDAVTDFSVPQNSVPISETVPQGNKRRVRALIIMQGLSALISVRISSTIYVQLPPGSTTPQQYSQCLEVGKLLLKGNCNFHLAPPPGSCFWDMAENEERGVRDDPAPLADPLRGDEVAKKRSSEEDGTETGSKKQKVEVSSSSSKSTIPSAKERQPLKFKNKVALSKSPIAIKLGTKPQPKEPDIKPSKSLSVAKVFGDDSDDEEEMPPEAKMRMKNRGRGTPTSAGPNSFNKSRDGFINNGRAWRLKKEEEIAKAEHEKRMKEQEQLEGWNV